MRLAFAMLALGLAAVTYSDVERPPLADRPDLSALGFVDQDGNKCTIADFRGKVVVVDFWTMWCGPCRRSLPDLYALQQDATARTVVEVIPCNLDEANWPIAVKRFVASNRKVLAGFRYYRCQFGKHGIKENLGDDVRAYPTTLIVDREGRLAAPWSGYSEGAMVKEVNALLGQPSR